MYFLPVELSSKFSVKNFAKDQETLDNAANALSDYENWNTMGCRMHVGFIRKVRSTRSYIQFNNECHNFVLGLQLLQKVFSIRCR